MSKTEHARLTSTKASRMKLCGELRALAYKCGAEIEQKATFAAPGSPVRGVTSYFIKGPYRCMVTIEGGTGVGSFLGHWYIEGNGPEKYDYEFASAIRGRVNPHHWRKATMCQDCWFHFLDCLETGLRAIVGAPYTWTMPKHPGDHVRRLDLTRGEDEGLELGFITIQVYTSASARVGAFLPGRTVCSPGDTPKTEPEHDQWCDTRDAANAAFDLFVDSAKLDGWRCYYREGDHAHRS